jgi:hypothetical protein
MRPKVSSVGNPVQTPSFSTSTLALLGASTLMLSADHRVARVLFRLIKEKRKDFLWRSWEELLSFGCE